MTTVSIAMATYNGGHYINEQLESFMRQTSAVSELVVCDDMSTDDTVSIVEHFRKIAPFDIHITQNKTRLGYGRNFRQAAKNCKGDIILFSDQDDIWYPEKTEAILEHFRKYDSITVTHDMAIIDINGELILDSLHKNLANSGLASYFNTYGCCMAFRAELKDNFEWPVNKFVPGHDDWVALLGMLLNRRGVIDRKLISRRYHGNNVSGAWVPGGNKRIRKWMRTLHLPPFTSTDDIERYLSLRIPGDAHHYFAQIASDVCREGDARRIIEILDRNKVVIEFISSKYYSRCVDRAIKATVLLILGYYRSSDCLQGYALDIVGKRMYLANK